MTTGPTSAPKKSIPHLHGIEPGKDVSDAPAPSSPAEPESDASLYVEAACRDSRSPACRIAGRFAGARSLAFDPASGTGCRLRPVGMVAPDLACPRQRVAPLPCHTKRRRHAVAGFAIAAPIARCLVYEIDTFTYSATHR